MTIGHQHPSLSRIWLHSERTQIGKGSKLWLRAGRLTQMWEFEYVSPHEWAVYYSARWHVWGLLRVDIGPGVIPF